MWSNEPRNWVNFCVFIPHLILKAGRQLCSDSVCEREIESKERKERWREITKQGQIPKQQNPTTQRLHPKLKPKATLCWDGSTAHAGVVLWWQIHNNASDCWWMCVVKCERSDKQTAAASRSGVNECVSSERLQFSAIKACQSQALVWLMIQIQIKYTAA